MLVVFGGLPGTGKTSLAHAVADALGATLVRVDTIEVALQRSGLAPGFAGYAVGNAVASDQLAAGRSVVVDAVNPVRAARDGWADLAATHRVPSRFVEVVCSDADEHRRRVEARVADLDGHVLPTWADVVALDYEPWVRERLVVDNLGDPHDHVARILTWLSRPDE